MAARKYGVTMPSTLQRSSEKAQRTYAKTMKSAEAEYGSGERAGRTAYSALKHGFEKVGDHWVAKRHPGPSDPQAAKSGVAAGRGGKSATYRGVDMFGHTRRELYERARKLGIAGRSTMTKDQLAQAIGKKQG